ncbi:hypothetical protein BHE74_00057692 [Ensete ventricosum]|nr:hypothetical protein GW17_00020201 [Ensete ventricosum]RWW37235.1 hypothetical protein BHE74_00057692 [Ensete ventricosum]RZS28144.1 hypothetical protein BHM03_00061701 [Ensete ventricosum]
MGSSSAEAAYPVPIPNLNPNMSPKRPGKKKKTKKQAQRRMEEEVEDMGLEEAWKAAWPRKSRPGGGVTLEGYVEVAEGADRTADGADVVGRTRSLTDDDLDELKGCLDLGFGFSYEEIPELRGTLPALELCYSMSRLMEPAGEASVAAEPCAAPPVANWKISSPGKIPFFSSCLVKIWLVCRGFRSIGLIGDSDLEEKIRTL